MTASRAGSALTPLNRYETTSTNTLAIYDMNRRSGFSKIKRHAIKGTARGKKNSPNAPVSIPNSMLKTEKKEIALEYVKFSFSSLNITNLSI
jgi:hypothetical protein